MINEQPKGKDRHPSTAHLVNFLAPNPNLRGKQRTIATEFWNVTCDMLDLIPQDGPELTAGLRKLLEAKDCFVRASLDTNPVDYRDR